MATDYVQREIEKAAQSEFASKEAESSVLGCLLKYYNRTSYVLSELTAEDFYWPEHQVVFRSIKRASAEGMAVTLVTVDEMIGRVSPELAKSSGTILIECFQNAPPSSWAMDSHKTIVKELAVRRRAMQLVGEIQTQLKDPTYTINEVMDRLRTEAGNLVVAKHNWVSVADLLLNTFTHLEKRAKGEIASITTGIQNVDKLIGGFFPGELTVIGARPGVGKSIFGMNLALKAAEKGFTPGVCSREMADIQFGQRILSYETGINGMKLRKAELTDDDWAVLSDGMIAAADLPAEFLFTVQTVEDLRAEVQVKLASGKLDILIVDYLQLMKTAQRFKEDRLRVGQISQSLKNIAKDFNIPVVALAQVKRYAGGARAKMPTLEDLKDSGSIEQDADNVIFIHNPFDSEDEYVDPRDRPYFDGYAEKGFTYLCLGIAKQRQGTTGKVCVLCDESKMRYYAIDRSGMEAPPT